MSSEYTLKLKAVLDDSDVQKKLNQLKKQQNGTSSSGASGNSVSQNSQILTNLIRQLNQNVSVLNQSIRALILSNKTLNNIPLTQGLGGSALLASALAKGLAGGFQSGKYTKGPLTGQNLIRNWMNNTLQGQIALQFGERSKTFKFRDRVWKGKYAANDIIGSSMPFMNKVNLLHPVIPQTRSNLIYNMAHDLPFAQPVSYRSLTAPRIAGRNVDARGAANRFDSKWGTGGPMILKDGKLPGVVKGAVSLASGFLANQVGGTVGSYADYYQAAGNTLMAERMRGSARSLQTGGNILAGMGSGAMMGGMLGGAPGAAIGAAIGGTVAGVNQALDSFKQKLEDTTAAIDSQRKAMFGAQDVDETFYTLNRSKRDKAALEKKDIGYFQNELKEQEELVKKQRESLKEVGYTGEESFKDRFKLREYEKETLNLMKERGVGAENDPEIKRRQNVAALAKANLSGLLKSEARVEQVKGIIQQLKNDKSPVSAEVSGFKPEKHSWAVPSDAVKLGMAKDNLAQLQETLGGLKAPDMTNVNSLAAQGYMISKNDDEIRLDETNNYLNELTRITRDIRDQEREIATYG